ncbi:hypothetical protein OAC77_01755 [Reinekea forsetii]|nr:hypothetical protein [Reinekea forsetii]
MLKIPLLTALACTFVLSACETPTDDTAAATTDTTTTDDAARSLISGSVALPSQMALVSTSDATRSATRAGTSTRALISDAALAAFADESDYNTERQNIFVYLDASEPIDFIDSLLCFTGQTEPLAMNGEGNYVAWSDAGCFEERSGGGQEQGAAEPAPSYIPVIVHSSQATDDSPLIINGWVPKFPEQGGDFAVKMLGEVTETPTEETPFGIFKLAFGLLPTMASPESDKFGMGEVISSRTEDNSSSFTLYQEQSDETQDGSGNSIAVSCITQASVNYNQETEIGRARTSNLCVNTASDEVIPSMSRAFALAANADYIHMRTTDTLDELTNPTAQTVTVNQCLDRNSVEDTAFTYGLYDLADGSEVVLNSGVQLHVDADGNGSGDDANGYESWGQMGYGGSWREDDQPWTNGEKVQESTRDNSTTGRTFTVKAAPGKLIKNTVVEESLENVRDVDFQVYLNESGYPLSADTDFDADGVFNTSSQLRLKVNAENNGFDVTGIITGWDDDGPVIDTLDSPVAISLATNAALHMWSRQLGGDITFTQGALTVSSFVRTYVNGSETASGELFDGIADVTLRCVESCIKAGVAPGDIDAGSARSDVYASGDRAVQADYTFAKGNLTLVDGSNAAIGFAGVTQDNLEASNTWGWGLQTGPMVTGTTITADQFYSGLNNGTITTFYVWETGLNPWQQQTVLVDDATSAIVSFDRPLGIKYTHSTANDRNGSAAKDGAVFVLEYGGKGNLYGLPWEPSGNNWAPVISLADGVVVADRAGKQYIFKALEVEQNMTVTDFADGFCSDLPFDAPSEPIPTSVVQDVFGLGTMPAITDEAPSVIGGDVQTE